MASKIFNVKVVSYDQNTGMAKLMDAHETDDVVTYNLFVPAAFGGRTNPYPKVGEELRVRYGRGGRCREPMILECWRPQEEQTAPA